MKSSYNQKVMIYFSCTNMDHSNMRRKILCEATVLHRHNGRSPQPCRNVPSVDGVTLEWLMRRHSLPQVRELGA